MNPAMKPGFRQYLHRAHHHGGIARRLPHHQRGRGVRPTNRCLVAEIRRKIWICNSWLVYVMETIWKLYGNCMETIWKLYGNYMETLCLTNIWIKKLDSPIFGKPYGKYMGLLYWDVYHLPTGAGWKQLSTVSMVK